MFGYVRIFKPELTFREYEQYRGIYCSLCRSLGKRYSLLSRLTLSYDFTFLALFHMALDDSPVCFSQGRCPFRPTKKCAYCNGDGAKAIDYAADVAVLLTYYKLEDSVRDDGFWQRLTARVLKRLLLRDYHRAADRRPEEATWAKEYLDQQWQAEMCETVSVDAAAHPTALFLSRIAAKNNHSEVISRFGYCLGRFVYLADAADDLEDDKKSGSFNPFLLSTAPCAGDDFEQKRRYAAETLHASTAVCAECYELLDVLRFDGIVRNILYRGMPAVIERIQNPQHKKEYLHEKPV